MVRFTLFISSENLGFELTPKERFQQSLLIPKAKSVFPRFCCLFIIVSVFHVFLVSQIEREEWSISEHLSRILSDNAQSLENDADVGIRNYNISIFSLRFVKQGS